VILAISFCYSPLIGLFRQRPARLKKRIVWALLQGEVVRRAACIHAASEGCGWWIHQGVEPLAAALANAMLLTRKARIASPMICLTPIDGFCSI
jgi:hypothetical protein